MSGVGSVSAVWRLFQCRKAKWWCCCFMAFVIGGSTVIEMGELVNYVDIQIKALDSEWGFIGFYDHPEPAG